MDSLISNPGWPAFGPFTLPLGVSSADYVTDEWRVPPAASDIKLIDWKEVRETIVDTYKKAKAYILAPERVMKASAALTAINTVAAIYNIHHGNAHHCHAQVALGVSNVGGAAKAVAIGTMAAVAAYREAHPPIITLGLSQRSAERPSAQLG